MSVIQSLPRNTARFMGGDYGQLTFYMNGHLIDVFLETTTLISTPCDTNDPGTWLPPQSEEDLRKDLEVVQGVLGRIEMGRSTKVYLLPRKEEGGAVGLELQYDGYGGALDGVNGCLLWAPRVDERSIEWVKMSAAGLYRTGIWKKSKSSREDVDVDATIRSYEECTADEVRDDTHGHWLLDSLGLSRYTFPLLGHVMRDDKVVGFITQPVLGKRVGMDDKTAVYAAIGSLHERGLVLGDVWWSRIVITGDGSVKFPRLASLTNYDVRSEEFEEAANANWEALNEMFLEVDDDEIPSGALLCCSIRYENEESFDISSLPTLPPRFTISPLRFEYLTAFNTFSAGCGFPAMRRYEGGKAALTKRRGFTGTWPRIDVPGMPGAKRRLEDELEHEERIWDDPTYAFPTWLYLAKMSKRQKTSRGRIEADSPSTSSSASRVSDSPTSSNMKVSSVEEEMEEDW